MKTPSPADSDTLVQDAAHWCMRLHAEDFSEEERGEFQRWLAADPRHAAEYAEMEEIWALSELLPRTPAPELRNHAATRPLGWLQGWIPSNYQRYEAEGNVRHAVLPDGSEVELDLNTQLSFANFKDIRRVSLDRGEAYFHVTHDSAHPFVVKAGNGSITVTGTRFNVWKYQDNVVVTVTEGSVKVRSEGSGNDSSLTPGMQASYYPGLLQPLVEAVDTRQTLAWREGRLVLDDLPLSKALPLINRYLDAPLVLGDRSAAKLRIGGIYSTRDIRSLVDALPKVLPVDLEHREDGSIRISSRYAQL